MHKMQKTVARLNPFVGKTNLTHFNSHNETAGSGGFFISFN
jgi:hypothetical protein